MWCVPRPVLVTKMVTNTQEISYVWMMGGNRVVLGNMGKWPKEEKKWIGLRGHGANMILKG